MDHVEPTDFRKSDQYPSLEEFPSPGPKRSITRFLIEALEIVLIAGGLFLLVNFLTARVRVESISMQPNLREGEFVVINRLAYKWNQPQRGDIIVFRFPGDPEKRYIKRVIGLEGDTLLIENGQVYVNGELLHEPYISTPPVYSGDWDVGLEEVFVLGDNRNNSNDSKNWGALSTDAIIGKAVFIYWPPSEIGLIEVAGENGE
ncbi:MAG: signal peptidase I [Chloroflexi bacterium]|nr:signal peptidase I [Chloroflexota bacterium]